jgi:hypothetical protein
MVIKRMEWNELVQSIPHAFVELPPGNSFILLMYANSKT